MEERANAWRFEAMFDAAHHADLVNVDGEILCTGGLYTSSPSLGPSF